MKINKKRKRAYKKIILREMIEEIFGISSAGIRNQFKRKGYSFDRYEDVALYLKEKLGKKNYTENYPLNCK